MESTVWIVPSIGLWIWDVHLSLRCIFHGWVRWVTFCQFSDLCQATSSKHFFSKMCSLFCKDKHEDLLRSMPNFCCPDYLFGLYPSAKKPRDFPTKISPQRSVTIRSRGSKYFWVIWFVRVPHRDCESPPSSAFNCFGVLGHLRSIYISVYTYI